jgi:hypothetical protein
LRSSLKTDSPSYGNFRCNVFENPLPTTILPAVKLPSGAGQACRRDKPRFGVTSAGWRSQSSGECSPVTPRSAYGW